MHLDTVSRWACSTLCLLLSLASTSPACPFCGPVETPLSYSMERSSDIAIGDSVTDAVANVQGQQHQSFSLLSRIIPTPSGRKVVAIESAIPLVKATVETTFSGTALLFDLPVTGWTAHAADEMFLGYALQIPPLTQKILTIKPP